VTVLVSISLVFIFASPGFIQNIQNIATFENFPLYGIRMFTTATLSFHSWQSM